MILKYVLKNFTRRKVRTILMILSLVVSTGLIATMSATVETIRQSNVDLIASAVGRYDLSLVKRDTSPDPYITIAETAPEVLAADSRIRDVYPRFQDEVELDANGVMGEGFLLALDPAADDIGHIDVVDGRYQLGGGQAAILEETATVLNLEVGDTVDVAYSFPLPREEGQPAIAGASQRRTTRRFTITAIVRQDGVANGGIRQGLIVDLADTQSWLDLQGRAQILLATVDPGLYETNSADTAALRVRDVARNLKARLGDDYLYSLDKAVALSELAQGFLIIQALINTYGLMALGVVGLLVHTLVMVNVQEQRRDMAILRILGGQRNFLFILVIAEVLVIGLIGVALGVGLGQLITRYIVVPIIEGQMADAGINTPLTPQLTLSSILPVVLSAFIVLLLSSLKPARDAARTKVMHAINPGVADNIQIEDLAKLRERRPDFKMFLAGLALMLVFILIASFVAVESFGNDALAVSFVLLALGLLVLGLGLMFFITTVPFERLILLLLELILPRLTYFARRNVGRGQTRNTLISLLVLFSGVLPSFLATQLALENANFEATVRQGIGAPAAMQVVGFWETPEEAERFRLAPSFRAQELAAVPGVDRSAALTYGYRVDVADTVGFRRASFTIYGVDGRLNEVLYTELMAFAAGGPKDLDALLDDPGAIVISEGLASHLAVSLGDTLIVQGEGTDHELPLRIIAIARSIPSLEGIGRSQNNAEFASDALVSLDAFRSLITPLKQPLPLADKHLIERVLFTLSPGAAAQDVADEIGQRFRDGYSLWSRFFDIELAFNERAQATQRVFLLVLTSISFTTAVFGVFAVIYVTIYARRLEVGMMKAMGMRRRELTGMLIVESIAMTLGAALAGIAAGASMGYISFYGDRALSQRPASFAVDTTVMPFIVLMVVLASILGAAFSARRIVKKRAVEILRM